MEHESGGSIKSSHLGKVQSRRRAPLVVVVKDDWKERQSATPGNYLHSPKREKTLALVHTS